MKVKVIINNTQKDIKIPSGIRLLVRRCCNAVLVNEKFEGDAEVSVTFVNNHDIEQLNKQYMHREGPTDVLSFPLGENGKYDINYESGAKQLGDIVISVEKAQEQAEQYGHGFQREMAYLTVHSMLHLLGYDHVHGGLEQVHMREKEEEALLQLGLPRSASYTMEDF